MRRRFVLCTLYVGLLVGIVWQGVVLAHCQEGDNLCTTHTHNNCGVCVYDTLIFSDNCCCNVEQNNQRIGCCPYTCETWTCWPGISWGC